MREQNLQREGRTAAAKGGESTSGSNREQRIDDEVALHYERVQHEEELHYDSVDVPQQGCVSRVDSGGIRSEAVHYEVIDAAENFQMDGVGHGTKKKGQHRMTSQKEHQMQCMLWLTRARKRSKGDLGWCQCYHYTGQKYPSHIMKNTQCTVLKQQQK